MIEVFQIRNVPDMRYVRIYHEKGVNLIHGRSDSKSGWTRYRRSRLRDKVLTIDTDWQSALWVELVAPSGTTDWQDIKRQGINCLHALRRKLVDTMCAAPSEHPCGIHLLLKRNGMIAFGYTLCISKASSADVERIGSLITSTWHDYWQCGFETPAMKPPSVRTVGNPLEWLDDLFSPSSAGFYSMKNVPRRLWDSFGRLPRLSPSLVLEGADEAVFRCSLASNLESRGDHQRARAVRIGNTSAMISADALAAIQGSLRKFQATPVT